DAESRAVAQLMREREAILKHMSGIATTLPATRLIIPLPYNGSGMMALVAFLLALAFAQPALAASPPPAGAAPSVGELEQLVDTLQDDKARAALVTQLQALIAAQG